MKKLLIVISLFFASNAYAIQRHRAALLFPVADLSAPASIVFDSGESISYDIPPDPGSFRFVVVNATAPQSWPQPHRVYLPLASQSAVGDILVIDNRTYTQVWITDLNHFVVVSPSGPQTYVVDGATVIRFYFDGLHWWKW